MIQAPTCLDCAEAGHARLRADRFLPDLTIMTGGARIGDVFGRRATGQSDEDRVRTGPAAHRPSDRLPFAAS